ncbi:cysteine hydrolase family protein [Gordonia hankookensis]|uniref:Cysteine hydrolase n=1 Tax=Gordonia hankookensis TaxID=589403 RepID=A0ABR7WDA1_9ACTN|nr:cysteine hydrolase family protein [Gordonia hankookensis]MBD1320748.1 cysteine hydrolase [Gordonia hankookensis]
MTATPRRALIVVDVQQEYFDGPLQIQYPSRDDALANIVTAIDAATSAGIPIVVVQHTYPDGTPVFAEGTPGWQLHPSIVEAAPASARHVRKQFGSVFAGTDVADWLAGHDVDTITIVGFMANNCDIATAVEAEGLGLASEILSDATGTIHLANEAGTVSAEDLHRTLMVLLQSNFAAVATTADWRTALDSGSALTKNNLVSSAVEGSTALV